MSSILDMPSIENEPAFPKVPFGMPGLEVIEPARDLIPSSSSPAPCSIASLQNLALFLISGMAVLFLRRA